MRYLHLAVAALLTVPAHAAPAADPNLPGAYHRDPFTATFSIVARDPATGQLGVAVQSHWFQVGAAVPWAEAGVGAVATQSFVEKAYGPKGLALLAKGLSPQEVLDRLTAADPQKSVRQVALVDAHGRAAAWTGDDCIPMAGQHVGDGYSVQANLMDRDTVWPAMARAYEAALKDPGLDFAGRLLAALDAAQREGGDIRGRQSAAVLIVRAEPSGQPWNDRLVDLRVDDNPQPLVELRRLLQLHRAYDEMNAGDEAVAKNDIDAAVHHYSRASELAPGIAELPFWQAVSLFAAGRKDEALPLFRQVFAQEPDRWVRLVPRLPAAGLLPDDPDAIARILAVAPAQDGRKAVTPARTGAAPETAPPETRTAGETPPPFMPTRPHRPTEHGREGGTMEAQGVTVEGRLTDEGVECPALRDTRGDLYTLVGDLRGMKPGDRVRVEGTVAEMSHCMQGTTIVIKKIEKRR